MSLLINETGCVWYAVYGGDAASEDDASSNILAECNLKVLTKFGKGFVASARSVEVGRHR
jgi:putative sterol carrier protein